jgi:hypothetical protein
MSHRTNKSVSNFSRRCPVPKMKLQDKYSKMFVIYFVIFKIWRIRRCDYEEFRLLGYKNPVRTSQETHYFSVTEPSQLMLCKI